MEKFSHDLTLALEETSRVRAGHCWGVRRRTRSTGNLPCAPQPTEDSSSSPADGPNEMNECHTNSILSDSDDRQNFKLALKARQSCLFGNFESDSLNENFSPTRPNTRRKRKFKRMAVEYETTPSTPGTSNAPTMFPIVNNSVKKRVMKHTSQENFRANLFFCGKRKRSHRDRYHDYEHYRLHSSSVPRQRDFFTPKNSYLEYKNRNRATYSKQCERILPLNKTIISKIEKISQDSSNKGDGVSSADTNRPIVGFPFDSTCLSERNNATDSSKIRIPSRVFKLQTDDAYKCDTLVSTAGTAKLDASEIKAGTSDAAVADDDFCRRSNNCTVDRPSIINRPSSSIDIVAKGLPPKLYSGASGKDGSRRHHTHSHHKQKQSKRLQMKMQLQFDDPNGMDCGGLNDFLSSSSLSSSDSEAAETNESDREGDDELTDWPGNEAMVNFASKNDFKRAKPLRTNAVTTIKPMLTQIKGVHDESMMQDDDTLMSADDLPISPNAGASITMYTGTASVVPLSGITSSSSTLPPNTLQLPVRAGVERFRAVNNDVERFRTVNSDLQHLESNLEGILRADLAPPPPPPPPPLLTTTTPASMPIDIAPNIFHNSSGGGGGAIVESEMSGETSNHFLSSPSIEVREIRAGCRRIRDERPGFTIFSSVNEHLSRFLQDSRQPQLVLPYTDTEENGKLVDLAKLYSLNIQVEDGRATFTKTINTTQSVKIDQTNMSKFFLSDYKRRCYGAEEDSESAEMAT